MTGIESRTVDWWSVHTFVLPLLEGVGSWPMVGTLTWQRLSAGDPTRLAAIFDAAQHHALRVDMAQESLAEASRDIAAAADWQRISRLETQRAGIYIPRERRISLA